jgi:hypothetical protein
MGLEDKKKKRKKKENIFFLEAGPKSIDVRRPEGVWGHFVSLPNIGKKK